MELKVGDTVRVKKIGTAMNGFSVGDICVITYDNSSSFTIKKGEHIGFVKIRESKELLEFISRGSDNKLKVGDKVVILCGAGDYPLWGFKKDTVYTVSNPNYLSRSDYPFGCVEISNESSFHGYAPSYNLKKISSGGKNNATKGYIVLIETKKGTSVVSCKLYVNSNLVRTTEAKCSSEDKFSIKTGVKLAIERMFPEKSDDKK